MRVIPRITLPYPQDDKCCLPNSKDSTFAQTSRNQDKNTFIRPSKYKIQNRNLTNLMEDPFHVCANACFVCQTKSDPEKDGFHGAEATLRNVRPRKLAWDRISVKQRVYRTTRSHCQPSHAYSNTENLEARSAPRVNKRNYFSCAENNEVYSIVL